MYEPHIQAGTCVYRSPTLCVFDEWLDPIYLSELYANVSEGRWNPLGNSERLNPVWRLNDGPSFRGETVRWDMIRECGEKDTAPYAHFFRSLARLLSLASGLGVSLRRAKTVSLTPFVYPPGSALGFHDDSTRIGSFTLYIHPQWRTNWGGELLVYEEPWGLQHELFRESFFDNYALNKLIESGGVGRLVLPLPGRMVLQTAGLMHSVKRVDRRAGGQPRLSLTGFFEE
jgi:hypothetical protein